MHRTTILFAAVALAASTGCIPEPSTPPDPSASTTTTTSTSTTTTTTTTVPPEVLITASDPTSPATSTTPRLIGYAPTATTTVRIFPSADCTGVASGGDLATFSGAGIAVDVGLGTTTTFTAFASGPAIGICSPPFTYVNSLTPPTGYEHEPNGTVAEANAITVGVGELADIAGSLDGLIGPYDVDNFEFTVEAGRSIRIETFDWTGLTCDGFTDTEVFLYPPSGSTGGIDDDDGVGFCSLIDPAVDTYAANVVGGTYRILVRGTPAFGSYRVRITVT